MGKRGPEVDQIIIKNLSDFREVYIWILQVNSGVEANGLDRDYLFLQVRKRFSQAGLPIPQLCYRKRIPRFPCLGILIYTDLVQTHPPSYIFSTEVFFVQKTSMTGDPPANRMCMTWCRESVGDISRNPQGFEWSNLYSTVDLLVNQFLQESMDSQQKKLPSVNNQTHIRCHDDKYKHS
jgi:hypothetical protein